MSASQARSVLPPLVLLLLLPAATAGAGGAHVVGSILLESDPWFEGALVVDAPEGVLDATREVRADRPVRASWETATARFVVNDELRVSARGQPLVQQSDASNETTRFGAGELRDLRCRPDCLVLVSAAAEGGRLTLRGSARGAPEPVLAPWAYDIDKWSKTGWNDTYRYAVPAGWLNASLGAEGLLRVPAFAGGAGRLTILLYGVEGVIHADGRDRPFSTGHVSYGAEALVGERIRSSFLLLSLQGGEVAMPAAVSATLTAPTLRLAHEGSFLAPLATGWVRAEGRTVRLDHEPLDLEGRVDWTFTADAEQPLGRGWPRATLEGEAVEAYSGSVALVAPAGPSMSTGAVAGAAGALALAFVLKRLVAAWLYARIRPADLLKNVNRRRVHAEVLASPGVHVRELASRVGLSVSVARFHLRRLEAGGLVRTRREGGRRVAYPADAPPVGAEGVSATARRVLDLLGSGSALTQKEIGSALGISQRLASHHLRALGARGLVATEGPRPRRYRAQEPDAEPGSG